MNRLKIIVLFLALIAVKESLCVEFEGSLSDFVALTPHDKSLLNSVIITSKQRLIDSDTFNDCINMKRLDLSNTRLYNLPQHIFDCLINLQNLNLSGNVLANLPSNIFDKLKDLRYLFLGGNYFSKLSPDIFKNLSEINTIDFGSMKGGSMIIQDNLFSGLHNIEHLRLPGDIIFKNGKNSFLEMLRSDNPNIQEIVSVSVAVGKGYPAVAKVIMNPIVEAPATEVVEAPVVYAEPAAEVVVYAEPAAEVVVYAEPAAEVVVDAAPATEVVEAPAAEVVVDAEPATEVVEAPAAEVIAEPVVEVVEAPAAEVIAEPVVKEIFAVCPNYRNSVIGDGVQWAVGKYYPEVEKIIRNQIVAEPVTVEVCSHDENSVIGDSVQLAVRKYYPAAAKVIIPILKKLIMFKGQLEKVLQ